MYLSISQVGLTGGSTTSEVATGGIHSACAILVERLKPVKEKLLQESKSGEQKKSIDLSALFSAAVVRSDLGEQACRGVLLWTEHTMMGYSSPSWGISDRLTTNT